MRATRLSLMVLLVVLAFVLWNAAWVTDRCGEWTAALDEAEAALAQGGSGQQQLDALTTLWQEPQGYLHIVISHEELDEAEALLAGMVLGIFTNETPDGIPGITFVAAMKYDLYNETLNLTMIDGQNPFAEGKTQLQLTRCPDN